jgi:hypothetical protein
MTEEVIDGTLVPSTAARAEDIFRRYPHISAEETKEAVIFLKKGRHLDIGLVTGLPELKANIDAFRHEHRRALGVGMVEMAVFTLIFLALLGGMVWLLAR